MSGTCPSPINCDNKDITPEAALKMLVQVDTNGCAALNTIEVDGQAPQVLYVDCDNKDSLDWKAIFFDMIAEDSAGNWALRIIKSA